MECYRIVLVQSPALRLGACWFGAHNFIAVIAPDSRIVREIHGIARGPGGTPLRIFGGIVPFAREYLWGETYQHRTGFYDEAYPQADLFVGAWPAVAAKLTAAARVQALINARGVRYPWPAPFGANSNAYCATLIAAMGLSRPRIAGGLWAPSGRRLLLGRAELSQTAAKLERPDAESAGPDDSKMVRAEGEQQDHRDRHAQGQQNNRTHRS